MRTELYSHAQQRPKSLAHVIDHGIGRAAGESCTPLAPVEALHVIREHDAVDRAS
jgi:hypothetical protein